MILKLLLKMILANKFMERKSRISSQFLNSNNLSKLYANGSYYYLLFKIFNFKDLNLNLFFLSYFYPYNLTKILMLIKKN